MNTLHTIDEIRASLSGDFNAACGFLRQRWRHLSKLNEQARDPAWITLATEAQLEAQLAALAQRSPGDCPLYGAPFAVKDNIDVADWTTTAACPDFAYTATRTAHVVKQLMQAGAVLLGKTNLDQFATGLVGTRSPYGWVPNTFSPQHISGGSSSGSASVVARGLVSFALGTDTAGSGRIPAGFNNLVGVKPTPGTVSNAGVVPACRTLDCVSLLTLTTADAAAVFSVMSGAGALGADEPVFHAPARARFAFPPALRVGTPHAPFFVNQGYCALFAAACTHLKSMPCTQGHFDLAPFSDVAAMLYQGPWTAERYAVAGVLIDSGAPGVDPVVAEVIRGGKAYSAVDAFNALYRVRELETETHAVWKSFDVLMLPTAPNLPTYADVCAAPIARNSELGVYTNFVNLLGLAAVAVPFGFTDDGLPFGVTFIGPGGSDWALLELAARWQQSRALPVGARLRAPCAADTAPLTTPPQAMPLAVVGAHLRGMPLHHQLSARGARLRAATRTAPHYRLYVLTGTQPRKPALARSESGAAIAVEVYDMPADTIGSLLAEIPSPLGLGTIALEDGTSVKGFICEPWAMQDAEDITAFGGWRAYIESLAETKKQANQTWPR